MKRSLVFFLGLTLCIGLIQCKEKVNQPATKTEPSTVIESPIKTSLVPKSDDKPKDVAKSKPSPDGWKEITTSATGIVVDLKYATTDNFTKKQIYDCPKCFMRPEATDKLIQIHDLLKEKHGYGLKVFDCFRPRPYQQRLWDIVPDPSYVTPPAKGSMHSRGLAVDLTIVDKDGKELDMGTAFDFFGKEAHQDYTKLSPQILKNRALLKSTMEAFGFASIRTEWWHYSLSNVTYPLDAWVWDCE